MAYVKIAIPEMGSDLFRKYMKSKYASSLARSGAVVRWIDLENTENAVLETLKCDGLLLPGGADVDPSLYNAEREEKCGKPNALRDTAEPVMLKAFLKSGKPIFAICRGIQIMNVYFGGTLLQDIKGSQTQKHSDFLSRASGTHSVEIEKGTLLHEILGIESEKVNSMHHQAIEKKGDGLRVSARSSDGFIEGLELENYEFCLAVQWHPEHMSRRNEKQQALFDAFVNACRGAEVANGR